MNGEWAGSPMGGIIDGIKLVVVPNGTYSLEGGLANRTVTLRRINDATALEWFPMIQGAASSWNNAGAGANVSVTSTGSSPHTINIVYLTNVNWVGRCRRFPDGNVVATSSVIEINDALISAEFPWGSTSAGFARWSVIAHEIGHPYVKTATH